MSLMNSFWSLFDWVFPAIRLSDDLRLDDVEAFAGRSYAIQTRTLSTPNRLQHQPRLQATDPDGHRQRERWKDVERDRGRDSELASLRKTNEELRARIRELEQSLNLARQSVCYAENLVSPALPLNVHLLPPTKVPPSVDPTALQTAYDALCTSYSVVQQALYEKNEEVYSLRTFLTKTDEMSGAQLIEAIGDLNTEILQLAASISDEFTDSFDRSFGCVRSSDRELLYPALGVRTTKLLEEQNHLSDPTFVQFAIQAWEVYCVEKMMKPFCFGAQTEIQRVLSAVFQRIQETEPQATSSRWRALTHAHLRAYMLAGQSSSAHAPPPTPVTPDTPASPTNQAQSALAKVLDAHAFDNLRGIIAIMALAGCTNASGLHRASLQKQFGSVLARISEHAYKLSIAFREGIMSAAFEVVIIPPGGGSSSSTSSSKRGGLSVDIPSEVRFDSGTMMDAFANPADPVDEAEDGGKGNVLCTVALGLACVRRVETANDGTERYITTEFDHGRSTNGIQRTNSSTSSIGIPAKVLDRTILVKPKVLLDSVTQYLQP